MKTTIWNPNKNEDYELKDFISGKSFSSKAQNLYALEIIGEIDANLEGQHFLKAMLASSEELLVIVIPWLRQKHYERKLSKLLDMDYSQRVFQGKLKKSVSVSALLTARSELGGGRSGEWIFAGSDTIVTLSAHEIEYPDNSILNHDFNYFIYLAEMQQTFVYIKNDPKFANHIELLKTERET